LRGRYGDAENLLVRVLAGWERILGISYPDTQKAVIALAWIYEKMGRLDDARMLKQRISPSSL
jgi:hypothetical protein